MPEFLGSCMCWFLAVKEIGQIFNAESCRQCCEYNCRCPNSCASESPPPDRRGIGVRGRLQRRTELSGRLVAFVRLLFQCFHHHTFKARQNLRLMRTWGCGPLMENRTNQLGIL